MLAKHLICRQIQSNPNEKQRYLSPPIRNSNLFSIQNAHNKSRIKQSAFSAKCATKHNSLIKLIKHTLTQSQNSNSLGSNANSIITLEQIVKTEPVLPYLTKSSAVAKFIIRGYKPVDETNEYITSTKTKEKISDTFFRLKEKNMKKRLRNRLEFFEKNKRGTLFEKEKSIEDKRLMYTMSDMRTITDENEQLRETRIKEEGKNLADMVLSMEKDENITKYGDNSPNHDISRKNLYNVINRRRIIKAKGKFNDEEDTLGIHDLNQIKSERQITEHQLSKKSQYIRVPKFIKRKFLADTTSKFKGVNGKFVGVIC